MTFSVLKGIVCIACILLGAACRGPSEKSLLGATLADGASVSSLVVGDSVSVIVAVSPSHCFTCDKSLMEFVRTRPRAGVRFVVLSMTKPTAGEKLMFRVSRVKLAGVLRAPLRDSIVVEVVHRGTTELVSYNPSPSRLRELSTRYAEQ